MAKTTRRKITPKGSKLIKSPTCIKGFDEITEGGLPQNGTTLVSGNGGPGKKTAMEGRLGTGAQKADVTPNLNKPEPKRMKK